VNNSLKYAPAFILSFSLHLTIIGLFALNFSDEQSPVIKKQTEVPEIIKASILDEHLVAAKALELKQAQATKQQLQQQKQDAFEQQIKQQKLRLKQAEAKRKRAEQKAKQQAAERRATAKKEQQRLQALKKQIALEKQKQQKIKQQRLAEDQQRLLKKKRAAEVERKRKAEAAKKEQERIAIAKQKRQREQAEKLKIAAAKQAATDRIRAENTKIVTQAVADAKVLIQRKIEQNWNQPSNVSDKLACKIKVDLIPGGDVMQVVVIKSSGNQIFDASAERAVYKASPLPVPTDPQVFKQFRSFTFVFSPE
jgi:colicin import membrane protein